MGLTVVINTLNEEENIKDCIASVTDIADEIIVVDMKSVDNTKEIAKNLGAKVFEVDNIGYVEPVRNQSIEKASNEWILVLDADERVGSNLRKKIKNIVSIAKYDVIVVPRINYMFNYQVKNRGWWPDYQVRLFKKDQVKWSETIHKPPKIMSNKILYLEPKEENALVHYNYKDISQFVQKLNIYTSKEKLKDKKNNISIETLFEYPQNEFTERFVNQKGMDDGVLGYVLARLMEFYRFVEAVKYWENNPEAFKGTKQELSELKFKYHQVITLNQEELSWLNKIVKEPSNKDLSDKAKLKQELKEAQEINAELNRKIKIITDSKAYKLKHRIHILIYHLKQYISKFSRTIFLIPSIAKFLVIASIIVIQDLFINRSANKKEANFEKVLTDLDGISVIIPTWNKNELILKCIGHLEDILQKEKLSIPVEIIVIDNGSKDGTKESLKKLKTKVKLKVMSFAENKGFARAINDGVEKAQYNYIYLMNNDMFPEEGCFLNIVKFAQSLIIQEKSFFGLSSQVFFHDKSKRREESGKTLIDYDLGFLNVAHCTNEKLLQYPSITAYLGGGSSLFNKELFKQLGKFDAKNFVPMYVEDLDLSFTAWRKGLPSFFVPNSKILHNHRTSSRELLSDPNYFMHKNVLVFLLKHLPLRKLISFTAYYIIRMIKDKKYKQYVDEVYTNKNNLLKARKVSFKHQDIYAIEQLTNFPEFENKYYFK